MEQELIQILEMLVALVAALVANWQHRQKVQAIVYEDRIELVPVRPARQLKGLLRRILDNGLALQGESQGKE